MTWCACRSASRTVRTLSPTWSKRWRNRPSPQWIESPDNVLHLGRHRVRFAGFIVAPFILGLALVTGAEAKSPVTIHVKAVKGRVLFSYRGKTLTDSNLEQICAASRR